MAGKEHFSLSEADQHCTILKQFRDILYAQQKNFQLYLEVLDKQKGAIEQDRVEDIIYYVELEEKILMDILALKKTIEPLERMYRKVPKTGREPLAVEILEIKTVLEDIQPKLKSQLEQNKNLLSQRMSVLRTEIKNLRENPLRNRFAVYSNTGTPSFIDVHG